MMVVVARMAISFVFMDFPPVLKTGVEWRRSLRPPVVSAQWMSEPPFTSTSVPVQ